MTLNGQTFTLPINLTSGDFAEIEPDGSCTHYDADGFPLSRVELAKAELPVFRPDSNALRFTCEKTEPLSARAAVTVCALGLPFGKTNERLVCHDGKNWQVYGADRSKLSAGSLDTRLPLLRGGATELSFTCKDPVKAQVKLTKVYR